MQKLYFLILFAILNIHITKGIFNEFKFCQFQNKIYPEEVFNDVSGYGCYVYGHPARFKNNTALPYTIINKYITKYNKTFTFIGGLHKIDGRNWTFTFNYKNKTCQEIIHNSFKLSKYYQKWIDCAKSAEMCCKNVMTNENILPKNDTCPVVWDAWDCFSSAKENTNVVNFCPSYIYMGEPLCIQTSTKHCLKNGVWNQTTDYSTCEYTKTAINRTKFHAYGLLFSVFISLPAIIIFFVYPSLRITRVILHRNLLLATIIKNILVIISKFLINLNALENNDNILNQNGVGCKFLAFFERVAINSMYACMLVDGFYLHKIIVAIFRKDPNIWWFYSSIIVLSLVPILIWAGFKASLDNKYCWIVDETWLHWIIDGSRYLMLSINLILLLNIIRVLIWKLKKDSGSQHARATLRATLFLFPLFGIQFIMVSQRPKNATCFWDNVFYYVSYVIDSSQGILVSFFYCYFNKEVQILLKKSLENFSRRLNLHKSKNNFRRGTDLTLVDQSNLNRNNENIQTSKIYSWMQRNS